jgi:alkylation response protein AidB-like acyl-CoA dehydrogenase
LRGRRHYCSGAPVLDQALLTAEHGGGGLLFLVDLHAEGVRIEPSPWRSAALAATATTSVSFDDVVVPADALVGEPDFYLQRPGFWSGAVGVAAVWAGGAAGVRATMRRTVADEPHALAHLGAVEAACWAMEVALDAAGAAIDREPAPPFDAAMARALRARLLVDDRCRDVLDRAARALGPAPLAEDAEHAQRVADLELYLRQGHAERDLEVVGRHAARSVACPDADD